MTRPKFRPFMLIFVLASGCLRWSPFETDLSDDERNKTAENLKRLEARPDPPARYRIGLITDSHDYFDELSEVVDELNARADLELVVHLGDLATLGLREEYRFSLEQLERLDRPYFTVIGNHDALSNGKLVYPKMFGPYDYVVEHGGVRFVLFNSNTLEFGSMIPDLDWLDRETQVDSGEPVIALAHQRPGDDVPAYDIVLRKNRVEFLASGDLHAPGAYDLEGLRGFTVGAAKDRRYAILTVGDGPPEIESCHERTCVRVPP